MKAGINFDTCGSNIERTIKYCQTLGINEIFIWGHAIEGYSEKGYPDIKKVQKLQGSFTSEGLRVSVMGANHITEDAQLFSDQGVENLRRTIDACGETGIDTLMPAIALRKSQDEREEETRWKQLAEAYEKLLRHAEEAKVRIATHHGWSKEHMVRNAETLRRLIDAVKSEYNGITYCLGCGIMMGDNVYDGIRLFKDRVYHVHWRDNDDKGNPVFPDTGRIDFSRVLQVLSEVNFEGVIMPEHLPSVHGETNLETSTAFVIGYMKGLMKNL